MTAVGYTGGDPNKVDVAGDTMTGPLVLPGDPSSGLQAATKDYVDTHSGGGGGSGVPSSTVVSETGYGQSATAGVATTYSRGDHTHGTTSLSGSVPTAEAIGDTGSVGVATTPARGDHRHAMPAFGSVVAQTSFGAAAADGVASSVAHSDHTHGTPTAPTVPSASSSVAAETSFGISAAAGVATTYSRGDHTHGTPTAPTVPSASSTVTAETSYGASSNAGAAATYSKGDHTHGSPSLTSNAPTTSAVGDSAVVGTGTAPARDDHKHAREAFGAVTAQTTFGASSGNGAAATLARSDHTHGTPTQPAETVMFAFTGTAVVTTGVLRWYNRTGRTLTVVGCWAAANTQPTGADLVCDVNKNGTTIFTTQGNRPKVVVSTNGGVLATPDVTSVTDGDYITVDLDIIGSTIAGANVTVGVVYR